MRLAAVEYARKWAFARNPKYMDFSNLGGDCTNFVSQCLVAGGLSMDYRVPMGWFYKSPNSRAAAFTGVQFLYNYLVNNKRAVEVEISQAEIGDVIQLSFDGEKFGHSLIVVESGADPKVATHSYDTFGRKLSSYFYNTARALHITYF